MIWIKLDTGIFFSWLNIKGRVYMVSLEFTKFLKHIPLNLHINIGLL